MDYDCSLNKGLEKGLVAHIDKLIDKPWPDEIAAPTASLGSYLCGGNTSLSAKPANPALLRQLAPAPMENSEGAADRPPRKSATERPPPDQQPLREQDRLLPVANVGRLMAAQLPQDAKISLEAKLLMQEMVSEFICFITSEANDSAIAENRKTISQADHLHALENLDLDCYVPVLEAAQRVLPGGRKRSGAKHTQVGLQLPRKQAAVAASPKELISIPQPLPPLPLDKCMSSGSLSLTALSTDESHLVSPNLTDYEAKEQFSSAPTMMCQAARPHQSNPVALWQEAHPRYSYSSMPGPAAGAAPRAALNPTYERRYGAVWAPPRS